MRIARNPPPSPGPSLFRLVRYWSRRWIYANERATGHPLDVAVLDAIHTAGRAGGDVSVGDVATQLGLDRSGASRLIAAASDRGLLARSSSEADARRSHLTLTDKGRHLLREAFAWQTEVIDELLAEWDPADVAQFARYLDRLADEVLPHTSSRREQR